MNSAGDLDKNFRGRDTYKLIDMIDPIADQDYATKKYHDDHKTVAGDLDLSDLNEKAYNSLTGRPLNTAGTMNKDLIGSALYKLTDMIDPTDDQDYCTKAFHDANLPSDQDLGIGKESDDIVHSNDDVRTSQGITMTKVKEIIIYKNLSGLRVLWEHNGSNNDSRTSQLYINDEAVGAEHTTAGTEYAEVFDDISDIIFDDKIQIYVTSSAENIVSIRNMKIQYLEFENNDPE